MYGATDTSSKSTLSTSLEHKAPLDGNNVGGCTDKAIYSRKEQDFIFVISRKHLQVTIASIVCGCCAVVFVPLFLSSSIGSSEYYHPNNPIRDWYRIREGIRKAKNAISFLNTFSMDQATSKSNNFEMLALLAAEDYQKITFGSTEAKHHKHLDGRVANGCEATVQIIRHCEKDQSSSIHHCSYQGFERAQYLKTLYGTHRRWPVPSVIYALSGRRSKIRGHHIHFKKMVYREVETVLPLALLYNIPIMDKFGTNSEDDLSKEIFRMLQTGDACGKLILICWKHSDIPRLAQHLGCSSNEGCPLEYFHEQFDQVWEIKYVYEIEDAEIPPTMALAESEDNRVLDSSDGGTWKVFGSVQQQQFDPLEFSSRAGDYPIGGTKHSGRWSKDMMTVEDFFNNRNDA